MEISLTHYFPYQCSIYSMCVLFSSTDKPRNTKLENSHTRTCLNDSVTLSCTTYANPPVQEYRFYINDQVVHTSGSGVYQFLIPQSGNNTYTCEPKNTIGYGDNASVTIATRGKFSLGILSVATNTKEIKNNFRVIFLCFQ